MTGRSAPCRFHPVRSEFIAGSDQNPQCHASTTAETPAGGLVAAWFGGTAEAQPDVCIYVSRLEHGRWASARQVADGVQPDGRRFPTWNPVLFQPRSGPLHLFYKVGPSPERWWGMVMRSRDGGRTWDGPERLPDGVLGPSKNKPVELADGTWISGSSTENPARGWEVHVERSRDQGRTWEVSGPLPCAGALGGIQPSVLTHRDGRLQLVCRTQRKILATAWSEDAGCTWSRLVATDVRIANSGLDATTLRDGRHVLACNPWRAGLASRNPKYRALGAAQPTTPDAEEDWGVRWPLELAVSDDGLHWDRALTLEQEPCRYGYAYPALIQARDGTLHVTYTWDRKRIKHVVLAPEELRAGQAAPAAAEARP